MPHDKELEKGILSSLGHALTILDPTKHFSPKEKNNRGTTKC